MSEPRRIPRMDELIAEKGLRHFERKPWVNPRTGKVDDRVRGERPAYRFLVARDEWDRTFAPLLLNDSYQLTYGGWPVEPADFLRPGSIVFVEDSEGTGRAPE
jgi:hypothetical protein